MIDLSPFCGTDQRRPNLHLPFSRGEHTYATNGHILVRVPRLPHMDEVEGAPAAEILVDRANKSSPMRALPRYRLLKPEKTECLKCEGRGTAHECPDCGCKCEDCGGSGKGVETITVSIGPAVFDSKYIAILAGLQDVRVPAEPPIAAGMYFTFADGGEGLLMPMRSKAARHVDEPTEAP